MIGPGQHGLGCVVAAHAVGSRWIGTVGLARDHRRLEAARRLGSDDTFVNRDEGGLVGEIVEATDGSLCDVVIDTTPAPSGLDLAVQCAAPGGRVVMAADKTGPCETRTLSAIMRKELRLIGVRGRDPQAVDTALEVIRSGGYPLDVMCTHEFGLTEVDRALRIVGRAQEPDAIHVTVAP